MYGFDGVYLEVLFCFIVNFFYLLLFYILVFFVDDVEIGVNGFGRGGVDELMIVFEIDLDLFEYCWDVLVYESWSIVGKFFKYEYSIVFLFFYLVILKLFKCCVDFGIYKFRDY